MYVCEFQSFGPQTVVSRRFRRQCRLRLRHSRRCRRRRIRLNLISLFPGCILKSPFLFVASVFLVSLFVFHVLH